MHFIICYLLIRLILTSLIIVYLEAVIRRCSVKKMFLEISENSQKNNFTKKETLAQVFSCEFWEISKTTFFHRAPPVAVVSERWLEPYTILTSIFCLFFCCLFIIKFYRLENIVFKVF